MKATPKCFALVAPRPIGRRIAAVIGGFLILVVSGLALIPWRQTIVGVGEVIVFDAMSRPQKVSAPIPGRLVRWYVQEGEDVKAGQVIAELQEIDSKFLDPGQTGRVDAQISELESGRDAAKERYQELVRQRDQVDVSRRNAIATARQRVQQSKQRLRQARQAKIAAEKSVQIAREVAARAASERVDQTQDRIEQAKQSVQFAKNNLRTAELQRKRIGDLFKDGLRSKRDDEVAENDLVKARTELARAESALSIAERDRNVGALEQNRASIEIERVMTEHERAKAAVDIAERDLMNAEFDAGKIDADTAASSSGLSATMQSAKESIAKSSSDIVKADIDRRLLNRRVTQSKILAPTSGRIVRLNKVGAGEMIKVADEMAVIMPAKADRHVELMLSDNDISLVQVGDLVRLQFAGWPAVQFAGIPTASIGTYGGRIILIDPIDDGTKRFRVVVEPHRARLSSGRLDEPWPGSDRLRPGAEVVGWVMLGKVPLGYEVWRQLNAFPPSPAKKESSKPSTSIKVKFGK